MAVDASVPDGHREVDTGEYMEDFGFKIEGRAINMLPLLPGQVIGIANQGSFVVKYNFGEHEVTKIHEF